MTLVEKFSKRLLIGGIAALISGIGIIIYNDSRVQEVPEPSARTYAIEDRISEIDSVLYRPLPMRSVLHSDSLVVQVKSLEQERSNLQEEYGSLKKEYETLITQPEIIEKKNWNKQLIKYDRYALLVSLASLLPIGVGGFVGVSDWSMRRERKRTEKGNTIIF